MLYKQSLDEPRFISTKKSKWQMMLQWKFLCVCVCAKCTYISPQDRCLKVELLDQRTYFWNVIGGASKSLCPLTLVSGSVFSHTFLPIMQNWMCLLFYCVFYHWWNLFFIFLFIGFISSVVTILPAFPFSCFHLFIYL